jgi:hypothetical protein
LTVERTISSVITRCPAHWSTTSFSVTVQECGLKSSERMRGEKTFDEAFSKVVGVFPATAENQF